LTVTLGIAAALRSASRVASSPSHRIGSSDPNAAIDTRDSVAGRLLRLNTEGLALIESVFFGIGLILMGDGIVETPAAFGAGHQGVV
jgi:hypothetical protein